MRAGMFLAKAERLLAAPAVLVLALVLFPGCEPDPYPASVTYPVRSDPLITDFPPGDGFPSVDSFGNINQAVAAIEQKAPNVYLDPNKLPGSTRRDIGKALEDVFGTPAKPKVAVGDAAAVASLELDEETLARGSKLYRRHCLHCHGVAGDGRGPTAPWVHPHPRDYRRGMFKFQAHGTQQTRERRKPDRTLEVYTTVDIGKDTRPHWRDLLRTLRDGIEGTSMPSFKLLPEDELQDIISYVIHLSIRGGTEFRAMRYLLEEKPDKPDIAAKVAEYAKEEAGYWGANLEPIPVVKSPYPADLTQLPEDVQYASIRNGFKLFTTGECITCHIDFGRQAGFRYDAWGTMVRPRNLTEGNYRGGRRPLDLYYRINGGIFASNMPKAAENILSSDKNTWDLVHFLWALPYPAMLPPDVRDVVYGSNRDFKFPKEQK